MAPARALRGRGGPCYPVPPPSTPTVRTHPRTPHRPPSSTHTRGTHERTDPDGSPSRAPSHGATEPIPPQGLPITVLFLGNDHRRVMNPSRGTPSWDRRGGGWRHPKGPIPRHTGPGGHRAGAPLHL